MIGAVGSFVKPDLRGFLPQIVMRGRNFPAVNNHVSDERRVVPSPADSLGPVLGESRPIQRAVDVGIEIPARQDDAGVGGVAVDTIAYNGGRPGATAGRYIAIDGVISSLGAPPPPFLLGKLKDDGDGLAGNTRFALGQPALLGGDKAAKLAAFPPINGIIPLVAVFAGGPSFRLAESVRLVKAAVEGLAPVLGQGFQNGGRAVGVGKGLPIGTVPRDGTGLRLGCPPPLLQKLRLTRQRCRLPFAGTWQRPPG